MKALLFPGQGSQIVGMGRELFNNFTIIKNIFEQADQKLKFKISKIILEGPENELKLTKNTQPAILTVSYAIYKLLTEEFGFNTDNNSIFSNINNFGIGTETPDIGILQINGATECMLCLESTQSFNIHDKINLQFGVRDNNIYYPRTKIESVFNGAP